MCAQWTHANIRNKLRSDRFARPVRLDEDIVTALLLWKYKDEKYFPTFYEESASEDDEDLLGSGKAEIGQKGAHSRRARLISQHGEDWLLSNKHLADQFLDDCDRLALYAHRPSTSLQSQPRGHDRYERLFTEDLHRNCCYPLWPEGVSGIVPILLWSLSYAYRSEYVWANRVWWFLLCTHSVEAVLVFVWMLPVGFSYMCTFTWCVFSFVNGWPCTYRAKILAEISLNKQQQQLGGGRKGRRDETSVDLADSSHGGSGSSSSGSGSGSGKRRPQKKI
jgi:hypothetical protein